MQWLLNPSTSLSSFMVEPTELNLLAFCIYKTIKKMKKIVIWLVGSNATGKTTQAALIHKKLRSELYLAKFVQGSDEYDVDWIYTQCGEYTANLGRFSHSALLSEYEMEVAEAKVEKWIKLEKKNSTIISRGALKKAKQHLKYLQPTDCCGTDTMSKKAQIMAAFETTTSSPSRIIVVEGIMATGTWIDFLKTKNTVVFMVHLKISLEDNVMRLRARRAAKKNITPNLVEFKPKTMQNISGKIRGFESLYKRMEPKTDYNMEIDAMENINVINKKILHKLNKIINEKS